VRAAGARWRQRPDMRDERVEDRVRYLEGAVGARPARRVRAIGLDRRARLVREEPAGDADVVPQGRRDLVREARLRRLVPIAADARPLSVTGWEPMRPAGDAVAVAVVGILQGEERR